MKLIFVFTSTGEAGIRSNFHRKTSTDGPRRFLGLKFPAKRNNPMYKTANRIIIQIKRKCIHGIYQLVSAQNKHSARTGKKKDEE